MYRVGLLPGMAFAGIICAASPTPSAAQSLQNLERQADDAYCSRQFNKSMRLSLRALNLVKKNSPPDIDAIAKQLDRLAGASVRLGDFLVAEDYFRQLLILREKQYGKGTVNAAFFMEGLAFVLSYNGKSDEAARLYDEVARIRRQMVVAGAGQLKARHKANAARVALKRRNWRKAFDTYLDAIGSIDFDPDSFGAAGDLIDLSSVMSSSTFAGLAEAAWHLKEAPGSDRDTLMSRVFEAFQWRWRTAAAVALEKVAERGRDGGGAGASGVRKRQDLGELLRRLQAEQEDLLQSWFAKRDKDPAYSKAQKRYEGLFRDAHPEKAIGNFQKTVELSQRLIAAYKECGGDRSARCRNKIDRLQKELTAAQSGGGDKRAVRERASKHLRQLEMAIDGYAEHERRRIELAVKIGRLSSTAARDELRRDRLARPQSDAASKAKYRPLRPADVQSLLHDDEALVTYLIDDEQSFVWALSRDQFVFSPIRLTTAALEETAATLRTGLEPPAVTGVGTNPETGRAPFQISLANKLYGRLFGPIEGVLANKRHLFLVPTNALTSLPFHVLVTEAPNRDLSELEGYRKAAWLGRRFALSTLPSISALKVLRADLARQPADFSSFIGFGDPDFSVKISARQPNAGDVLAVAARCSRSKFASVSSLASLPDTRAELETVRDVVGAPESTIHLGREATEARIKSLNDSGALARFRTIYFATHGLVTGEVKGLLEPALALTIPRTQSPADDGLLTASEIAQLRLNADWVVLSACNTSSSRRPGEETLSGLARAFLFAGARTLLISHWPVDSYAARVLVSGTFSALREQPGLGRAEALKKAMLDIIDKGDPVGAHPSFWAPFVIIGDGRR